MKHDVSAGSKSSEAFDFIVVGGGSAGCVMASRLSESGRHRVLLIEAGPDYPDGEPEVVRDQRARAMSSAPHMWPGMMVGAASLEPGGPPIMMPYAQGRVMGGGSSVNGMHAQRGEASDYDEWRQQGVIGWGWDDLIPYFNRLENDLDYEGPLHGSEGPVTIRRVPVPQWSELGRALGSVMERQGFRQLDDVNTQSGAGYGPLPLNATDRRMSSATAYLTREVRARDNLAIMANKSVKRLMFNGTRVTGVELADPAGRIVVAGAVVICSGAIHSPALLQRSGVGPGKTVAAAGIRLVADRPGVGQRMQNHPMVSFLAHLAPQARRKNDPLPPCYFIARFSSGRPDCPPADMMVNLFEYLPGLTAYNPLMRQFGWFMLLLNKAFSEGTVTINAIDPFGRPRIASNILADERDRTRILDGFARLAAFTREPEFDGVINRAFVLKPSPVMMKLGSDTVAASLLSRLGAAGMNGSATLRNRMLHHIGMPIEALLEDRAALEAFVIGSAHPGGHPSGTCRMGDPAAAATVVDSRCRVIGVEGVRVVDASIFPTLMRSGTNVPAMMAGEKGAAMILEDQGAEVRRL